MCVPTLNGVYNKKEIHLSLPVEIIAKALKLPQSPLDLDVTVELHSSLKLNLNCGCTPCCQKSSYQYAELNAWGQARAWDGTVSWAEDRSNKMPGEDNPANATCTVNVSIEHKTGTSLSAVGLVLVLGKLGVSVASTKMAFSATSICKCTQEPECSGNVMPVIAASAKELDVYPGRPATFTVTTLDRNGNLIKIESAKGEGLWLASRQNIQIRGGKYGRATFTVPYPGDGGPLDSVVEIDAWDSCDGRSLVQIPVHFHYPLQLSLIGSPHWNEGRFDIAFKVSDPELAGCDHGHIEAINLDVKAVGGEEIHGFVSGPSCYCMSDPTLCGNGGYGVEFIPTSSTTPMQRSVTITATDRYGLSSELTVPVSDRPPAFSPSSLSEEKTVYYSGGGGSGYSQGPYLLMSPSWEHLACLTVTDPDGDDLTISLGSTPRYGMANVLASPTGPGSYNVTIATRSQVRHCVRFMRAGMI